MSKRQKKQAQPEENGATTPPPAYFLSVTVENVRCFGEAQTLDLSDGNGRPAQWTVILGDNGTGKTTLLQAIAALEPPSTKTYDALPGYAINREPRPTKIKDRFSRLFVTGNVASGQSGWARFQNVNWPSLP